MKQWFSRFCVGLLVCMTTVHAADPKILRIATGELPPYATESRPDQGVALNVVRRAFELAGYKVEFNFMPWSRALIETRSGRWDGTAYWGRTEERERDFWHSENVVTEQWVFIHRKSIELDWKSLDDLKPYLMAVIRDYTYTPELRSKTSAGDLRADPTPDDLAALRKLVAGRVDIAPMERNVACDLLGRHFSDGEVGRLHAHPKLMTENFTTHLLLPRGQISSVVLLRSFNEGLKKLYESGEHARILKQVKCPSSWAVVSG